MGEFVRSRNPRKDIAASPETQEVILVHGTFASSSEDAGSAWWQVGSAAYQALQAKLPQGVKLARRGAYSVGPATTMNVQETKPPANYSNSWNPWRKREHHTI